jgi:hypothetical protein
MGYGLMIVAGMVVGRFTYEFVAYRADLTASKVQALSDLASELVGLVEQFIQ